MSNGKGWLLTAAGIVGLASILVSSGDSWRGEAAKERLLNAINSDAETIFAAYDANEVGADNAFLGKDVRLRGVVTDVGRDSWGIVVSIESPRWLRGVSCYFDNWQKQEVGALRRGDHLTVVGDFQRYGQSIAMRNCIVEFSAHQPSPGTSANATTK